MNIKIRAGNGLRARLATTVSFEDLFTELVKNSLQNNATRVHITYNKNKVRVVDNGDGFDHESDHTGMNEFEKYFVFGNSYTKQDKQLNLGEMGVGGKAANDKLSDMNNTHWTIHTINQHKKAFELQFKSTDEAFLDQVQPELREVSKQRTGIDTPTGTVVTVHNINPEIKQNGWPDREIRDNLQLFFNMLHFQTKKQNRAFRLWVNNREIVFNNNLPGDRWLRGRHVFHYMMNGKKHKAWFDYRLNQLTNRKDKHLLDCVDLISYTRVCTLKMAPGKIDTSSHEHVSKQDLIEHWNKYVRGYIMCPALSDVKDAQGMSAKDLSHHRLHPNHPVTKAFTNALHEFVVPKLLGVVNQYKDPDITARIVMNKAANTIFRSFNVPDEFITEEPNR